MHNLLKEIVDSSVLKNKWSYSYLSEYYIYNRI